MIHKRDRPCSFGPSPIGPWTFVARTTWSRRPFSARPTISSDPPSEYTSAVSTKLTPASRALWMIRMHSSWSVLPQEPNIIVPRQSALTSTPVWPSSRYSIPPPRVSPPRSSTESAGRAAVRRSRAGPGVGTVYGTRPRRGGRRDAPRGGTNDGRARRFEADSETRPGRHVPPRGHADPAGHPPAEARPGRRRGHPAVHRPRPEGAHRQQRPELGVDRGSGSGGQGQAGQVQPPGVARLRRPGPDAAAGRPEGPEDHRRGAV